PVFGNVQLLFDLKGLAHAYVAIGPAYHVRPCCYDIDGASVALAGLIERARIIVAGLRCPVVADRAKHPRFLGRQTESVVEELLSGYWILVVVQLYLPDNGQKNGP